MTALFLVAFACAIWLYLLLLRGGFWRMAERDDGADNVTENPDIWPHVVAIVPARNEALLVAVTVGSLLRQQYPGSFDVVVVDDHSSDATTANARNAAAAAGAADRLTVVPAPELADGWTGKLWAMNHGTAVVEAQAQPPDFLLFSDADIAYASDTLITLVRRAERDRLVLASLMAKLRCTSFAERAFIPAFIFFFRMLYPFAWVNRPDVPTAAAAGGCMLVRRCALDDAGGLSAVAHALIDDCALAKLLQPQGRIWLGLTTRASSLRAYESLGDVRQMIARCAFAQLRYSPLILLGTVAAIAVTYLAPPVVALFGTGGARLLAAAAWGLMALCFQPTLRFYGVSRWWGLALPAIAGAYLAFTLDSAWQHWRGRGGTWKGRVHVPAADRS